MSRTGLSRLLPELRLIAPLFALLSLLLVSCTGHAQMNIRPPEQYFSGPQLQIARALLEGDAESVSRLAPGQDLDAVGREDMTLLFFALQSAFGEKPAQLNALSALVRAGADPLRETPNLGTPLGVALGAKSPDYVRAFLEGGVDPNTRTRHGTPLLHQAARHHTEDSMRLLLKRGADPNARDRLGRTAAMQAVTSLQLDLVEPLLDAGSDPNAYSALGVSFAYGVASALEHYQNDPPTRVKLERIRDRIIAMGVQWPPMEPSAMRDWMRSQGMKVVVPAGHER